MRAATIILMFNMTGIMASDSETLLPFDILLPTRKPTTYDPWYCYTRYPEPFFDVPKPTGRLETAIYSYINTVLDKDCQPTMTDALRYHVCTFPPQSAWCAFPTAIPKNLVSEYTSFGSVASAWWAANSAEAVSSAELCPDNWFKAMVDTPDGAYFLNETIAWAGCYAAADDVSEIVATTAPTTAPTTTPAPPSEVAESSPKATSTTTTTTKQSNKAVHADGFDMWVVIAAAVAYAVWQA